MDFISKAFQNILNSFNDTLPNTIGVIVILILGFFVAKISKTIISKIIRKTGIDNKLKTSKLKLSSFIAKLIYFLIMIFVFMLALEKLGMTSILDPVKGLLDGFLKFIPNIVGAGLVVYIGYMLATIISEFVGLSGETIQKFAPKLKLPENINLVNILKKVVFIFIFIPLLISALTILKIEAVSGPAIMMLETFFDAIPRILVATIIMIIFVVAAKFLSGLTKELLDSINVNEILKILHIVSFVSWFAGLFYLPRLFVYHVENNTNREMNDVFQKMEYKLLRIIMNPAMILTWIFGLALIHYVGFAWWLALKLILVGILTAFHMYLAKIRKNLEHNYRDYTSMYLRIINEVPTILLVLIVILVVVKPF